MGFVAMILLYLAACKFAVSDTWAILPRQYSTPESRGNRVPPKQAHSSALLHFRE
jgi:hypothetical protein